MQYVVDAYLCRVRLEDVVDVWIQQVAEKVSGFEGQLRGHVVDRADEDSGPFERLFVLVAVGVIEAEGLVDGRALVHELDRAPGVGGVVADGQQPVRQGGSA